jgi:hypothetical protein
MTTYLLTNGLPIPNNFPVDNYETIHSLVSSKRDHTNTNEFLFFLASWKGFLHRFLACTDHNEKYIEAITLVGEDPSNHERYLVERELFNFWVNGLAAIECLCCALFAIGAIKEIAEIEQTTNTTFRINNDNDIKKISPTTTAEKFYSKFGDIPITTILKDLFDTVSTKEDARQYKEWKKVRDILAHRGHPGRRIALSSGRPEKVPDLLNFYSLTKEGAKDVPIIEITSNTTASMHEWLTKIIDNILGAAYTFVDNFSVESELLAMPLPSEQLSQPLNEEST